MNLMHEFTDIHYASKHEIAESLGKHLVDPVWNQLQQYRRSYMVKTSFVEFCLCPGIQRKLIEFYELLFQIKFCETIPLENMLKSSESVWMFQHLLKTPGNLLKRIHELCLFYQLDIELELIDLIESSELSLVAKLTGIMMKLSSSEVCILMIAALLNHTGCPGLLSVMEIDDLNVSVDKDGTYALEDLLLKWNSRMKMKVLHQYEKQELKLNHLVYQYPQLKQYQIDFYLNHHEQGYYYTIEQFIECSGVCYETGRCALKQMVDLGFYQMMKQGKKFVYTAR